MTSMPNAGEDTQDPSHLRLASGRRHGLRVVIPMAQMFAERGVHALDHGSIIGDPLHIEIVLAVDQTKEFPLARIPLS